MQIICGNRETVEDWRRTWKGGGEKTVTTKLELTRMAGHMIRRLHQLSTQVFQKHAAESGFDLTSVQFAALDALHHNPGIDQAQLSALIAYDRATIGGVVDRLEQKGLVLRRVSRADRRAREVSLSDKGEELFQTALPVVRALQDEILGRLEPEERTAFLDLARKALGYGSGEA